MDSASLHVAFLTWMKHVPNVRKPTAAILLALSVNNSSQFLFTHASHLPHVLSFCPVVRGKITHQILNIPIFRVFGST